MKRFTHFDESLAASQLKKKTEFNFLFDTSVPSLAKQCATLSKRSSPNAINSVRTENLILDGETLLYLSFASAKTFDFSNVLVRHCVRVNASFVPEILSFDLADDVNMNRRISLWGFGFVVYEYWPDQFQLFLNKFLTAYILLCLLE